MFDPLASRLHVAPFDRRPRDAVRSLLLAWIAHMSIKGVVEGLAIDVLRMFRKMAADRRG
jgi:hypothetical protein